MSEELKDSGTVTALSVVGFVFGLIGMLGSFIPCLGSLAFYISIPSSLISGIALIIANNQKAKKTFAIVALTIGLIGTVISGFQYFSIVSAGERAKKDLNAFFYGKESNRNNEMVSKTKNTETEIKLNKIKVSEIISENMTFGDNAKNKWFNSNGWISFSLSPYGNIFATLINDNENSNKILIYDNTGSEIKNISVERWNINWEPLFEDRTRISISPDEKFIAIYSSSLLSIFDISSGTNIKKIKTDETITRINSFDFSLDSKSILLAYVYGVNSNVIAYMDINNMDSKKLFESKENVKLIFLSEDKKKLAAVSENEITQKLFIEIWDFFSGKQISKTEIKKFGSFILKSFALNSDFSLLYLNERNSGQIYIFDVNTGIKLTQLSAGVPMGSLESFCYSKEGELCLFFSFGDPIDDRINIIYRGTDFFNLLVLNSSFIEPEKNETETSDEFNNRLLKLKNEYIQIKGKALNHFNSREINVWFRVGIGEYNADNENFTGTCHLGTWNEIKFIIKADRELAKKIIEDRNSNKNFYMISNVKILDDQLFEFINMEFSDPTSEIIIPINLTSLIYSQN